MEREFDFDVDSAQKAAKKSKEKGSGGKINRLKLKAETTGILLLPPLKGKPFIKEVTTHSYWSPKENKFVVNNVVSPTMSGEKDPIMEVGWAYREKYKDSDNKKLKDLWRMFMPKDHRYVNCINIKAIDEGPMVLDMPKIVFDTVTDEILEVEDDGGMRSICHLDEGRILKIKHNGGQGFQKKYEVVKFLNKTANLIEGGKVEKADLINAMVDLDKLEPVKDEAKLKEALATLKKIARSIEEKENEEIVDEDEMSNDFDDEDVMEADTDSESSGEDDDFDLD